ncbi:MAG TPA: flavin reductase family protein [Chloroflexi bacterium]|jgi:flavin reductase (DIM6/NTAB) family NADH-FMN oxidoreductase RutF|nr:flavin reductase family protein [Chloroflexota bacterium]
MKRRRDVFRPVYPTPAALITCCDTDGRPNIITLGEVYMLCLEPLTIGISVRPERHSHRLISETGEFVVNLPTAEIAAEVDYCGIRSGADVDKFADTGLTPEPAAEVRPPLIAECPVSIECRVRDTLSLGSHDVFVGLAVATHAEDWALDEQGQLDPVRARAIGFVGRGYWRFAEKVDRAFAPRTFPRPKE